ncbi:C-type lectin domain family 10 member A-like [Pyxicephalus adspersus]|uniref:C-type lectin domain-containing protein n=1 Tax=Pyxicephalus adspersus TaxID=30357 RepID=A0AAV3ASG0_PYXAD|nr:TPA: hypothetical protein GDO54_005678 [Pyxicephalus adspersus]
MMEHDDLERLHFSEDWTSVSRGLQWLNRPVSSRLIFLLFCVCAGLIIINIAITVSSRGARRNELEENGDYSKGSNGQESEKDGSPQKIQGTRKRIHSLPPDNETYDGACPDDWSQFQDNCYFFSNLDKSWMNSHEMCQKRKARLTVINTQEEQVFLTKLAMKIHVWIGLSEIDGEWKWVDATPFSSTPKNWAPGQPDEYFGHGLGGGEDCAQLDDNGYWHDEHCSGSYRYICEKKAVQ